MKHELISFKGGPAYPGNPHVDPYVESRLSMALSKAKSDGRKVLGFWRDGESWVLKLMVQP
jgi:hypothetical protein